MALLCNSPESDHEYEFLQTEDHASKREDGRRRQIWLLLGATVTKLSQTTGLGKGTKKPIEIDSFS